MSKDEKKQKSTSKRVLHVQYIMTEEEEKDGGGFGVRRELNATTTVKLTSNWVEVWDEGEFTIAWNRDVVEVIYIEEGE